MSRRGTTAGLADAATLDRAADLLGPARRVLVTGLADATLEAVQAACDLAEAIGGVVDAGSHDTASPLGPVVAHAGAVTAEFEELRDRADLVVLWWCDPDAVRPGFGPEFLAPRPADGGPRLVVAVGPGRPPAADRHLPLPDAAAADAARLVQAILEGRRVPPDNPRAAELVDASRELASLIRAAACVAFVFSRSDDPLGLTTWAVALLVRGVNHERPAFSVPLAASPADGLDDAAGAAAVLTWRYGAAGAIARADRLGGDFRPAECSAEAIVARGEVDAVLAVGRLPAAVEAAIASRSADLAVVRIDDRPGEPPGGAGPVVHLRCGPPAGATLRADGRPETVGDPAAARAPGSMTAILTVLAERLAAGRPS